MTGAPHDTPAGRAGYIAGLRQLADALEAHIEIPLPYDGQQDSNALSMGFHGSPGEARERLGAAVRAMPCSWVKDADEKWLHLNGQLAGLHIQMYAYRDAVCKRVVTGTEEREVEEVVTPAVTRKVTETVEIVTWDCGSILGPAAETAPGEAS